MSKQLLLGDEAIAQAALERRTFGCICLSRHSFYGNHRIYSDGTDYCRKRTSINRWCSKREKLQMEAALGMSFAGKAFTGVHESTWV